MDKKLEKMMNQIQKYGVKMDDDERKFIMIQLKAAYVAGALRTWDKAKEIYSKATVI